MPRLTKIRLLLMLPALLAASMPASLSAQDDPNDTPLGDVARTLRKKTPPSQDVIDDDNLTTVMEQAESRHAPGSALTFLMAGESKDFQVAAPDVTCSLSFSANAKSLLSSAYAQMELPPGEVLKLEGPATIEGDALIVSVYNRTDWHVSEVAVALTVAQEDRGARSFFEQRCDIQRWCDVIGYDGNELAQESEVRPEKKPDVTVIYRMRAAAAPWATTVFSAPLKLDLAPDEEWHWAIVQARGYPPQSYSGNQTQTTAETNGLAPVSPLSNPSTAIPALTPPQNSPVSLPQNPSVESTSADRSSNTSLRLLEFHSASVLD